MSIKSLILIITNGLVFIVVILLSFTFYNQFSKAIDERILLQLNSIKTLKKNQIEDLIESEWNTFLASRDSTDHFNTMHLDIPEEILGTSGIYDLTPLDPSRKTAIVLVSNKNNKTVTRRIDENKITKILLERTGMGNSGESYLVGEDYFMRSPSRFFPTKSPGTIKVETIGVKDAFSGKTERGVFPDYRAVKVYSAYGLIEISKLKLVILSEIDIGEVTAPLKKLRIRLLGLIVVVMLIAIILSLFLTRLITVPIMNMQESLKIMAAGNYEQNKAFYKISNEMKEMFEALAQLKKSLQGAVAFSNEIGDMNLSSQYQPKSENDILGKSLIKMRDKLREFRNKENKNRLHAKRLLVDGLEKERQRLSMELHDGLGPLLTTLKFYIENKVESIEHKKVMLKAVDSTIKEVRLMSNALMPSAINDFGVGAVLSNFVESVNASTDIDIVFEDLTKKDKSKLSKTQKINIFRIGQELINNALKHADANKIRITLSEFDDFVSFFYFDNGKGFDLKKVKLGSGIVNIRERVEICDGKIQIDSKNGMTTFEIELPITNE
ncbi:sensor histidine kinase [Algibacter mikhailovii]|uniref:sensor histidine kinase n=1 Tax=Algibacter mikhailovii TaxID=425498 RepID=UPI00167AB5E0|nr:ATP-binding protein [Algibacter mikhailovii]